MKLCLTKKYFGKARKLQSTNQSFPYKMSERYSSELDKKGIFSSKKSRRSRSRSRSSDREKYTRNRERDREDTNESEKRDKLINDLSDVSDDSPIAPPPPPIITKTAFGLSKSTSSSSSSSSRSNLKSTKAANAAAAGIQMKLAPVKKTEPVKKMKVASAFAAESSDDEVEEMPAECRMRMRNIGRDTPTSSGPNSFGKTKQGFCDSKKMFERNLRNAWDSD